MTVAALLFKLAFMNIGMTINTPLLPCLIFPILMTLLALYLRMFAYQRKFRLEIMIEYRLFPAFGIVAFFAINPQFLFMNIVFFMAVQTVCRYRLVFACCMAFIARCLQMLPIEPESCILRRIVIE